MNPREKPLPKLPLPNLFVMRIHVSDGEIMRQHLAYHFGLAFASTILNSPEQFV
jgi:hypothetical protein